MRSSAMADSWLARTDGENITPPRRVGEAGVGDDDGEGAVPSGTGRPQDPTWGLGGGDQQVEGGGVEGRGSDVVGEAALDEVSDPEEEDPLNGDGAAKAGKPR